jgi:hypothetical protein
MSDGEVPPEIFEQGREWVRASREFSDALRSRDDEQLRDLRRKVDALRLEALQVLAAAESRKA